jgi:hypothetical protein
MDATVFWLLQHGIVIDYVNENPECVDTKLATFTDKFYFNVILDDKAGFEGDTDWALVSSELDEVDRLFGRAG